MSDANGRDESALSDTATFVIAATSLIHWRLSCSGRKTHKDLIGAKEQDTRRDRRQHQPPSAAAPPASQKQWPSTCVLLAVFRLLTPLNDPINSYKTQLKRQENRSKSKSRQARSFQVNCLFGCRTALSTND